jgi:hypothetical protein
MAGERGGGKGGYDGWGFARVASPRSDAGDVSRFILPNQAGSGLVYRHRLEKKNVGFQDLFLDHH